MGKTSEECYKTWLYWRMSGGFKRNLTYSQWGRALKKEKFREIHYRNWGGIEFRRMLDKRYRRR